MDFGRVKHLVSQIVFAGAAKAAAHHFAVGCTDHQPTGHLQQPSSRIGLEPAPQLVGPAQ